MSRLRARFLSSVSDSATVSRSMLMGIPALSGHGLGGFSPKMGSLKLLDTTRSSILLEAKVNVTNPTNYSATVPFVDVNVLNNGTILAHATARDVSFVPGANHNILVHLWWDPSKYSGKIGVDHGREFMSQFISGNHYISTLSSLLILLGFNTTVTIRTHNGTIPALPRLGSALNKIEIDMPTPKLTPPKSPNHPDDPHDEDEPRFIDDATVSLA